MVQVSIDPVQIKQFRMHAPFYDPAAVDDQDLVSRKDGAQPVRDNNTGPPCHHTLKGILNKRFRFAVQAAGGFIQNKDARIFQYHTRECDALLLAAAQPVTAFAHDGVVFFRQRGDKVMNIC